MLSQLHISRLLGGLFILALLLTQGRAQTETGQITGKVTDSSGAVVAGATITIKSTATLSERNTTTNSQGIYALPNLQPGLYEMSVSADGFAPVVQRLQLRVGSPNAINIALSAAAPADPNQTAPADPNQKEKTPAVIESRQAKAE